MQENGIDYFSAHDLRRTAATGIAKLGHSSIVPDILGHKPQGVTRRHYDHYDRADEIKRALEIWGEAIEGGMKERKGSIVKFSPGSN